MASVLQQSAQPSLQVDCVSALQHAIAGFDREQLLWSSGYLAGLAAANSAEQLPERGQVAVAEAAETWSILYASETGNSRRVAEALAERSRAAGLAVELHDVCDYRPRSLAKVTNALFVVATHGLGEAPDGSEPFFEYWLSEKAPRLDSLNYSVLALGDSSYADFCAMGQTIDARLKALGATAVAARVDCDLDFETDADGWIERVVQHASKTSEPVVSVGIPYLRPVEETTAYTRARPFDAEILSTQRVTGRGSSKDVRHIELNLEGSGLSYEPGDSLGVVPQNPPELVASLLDTLQLDGAQTVSLGDESLTLSEALTTRKEITALSRPLLDSVAAEHAPLSEILTDRSSFSGLLATRQLIDVVTDYPTDWQPQEFVDALRTLPPRLYSIASSPEANPDEAHLTVAVVRYDAYGRPHWGSASNYLISGINSVPVYIEPNEQFRLPADGNTPIVMIGAGTGVAPYRSFVEHRQAYGQTGENWLIFGDRNFSSDFLYQIEWLRYRKSGALTHLDAAFSRDQEEKVYVQHRILDKARQLYEWLERGAHVYVCGDATRMAVDVHEALQTVLQTEGGLGEEQSAQYLSDLKSARRYQRDVY